MARRTAVQPAGRPVSSAGQGRNLSTIRERAQAHGYTVSDRGRVSAAILATYDAAP
ncbi:hypothetical protein CSX12_13095 [Microbacterium sp. Y-01]|nr:hypothetical protein CSX12_13095 [Microbacterium sp. Y-01]